MGLYYITALGITDDKGKAVTFVRRGEETVAEIDSYGLTIREGIELSNEETEKLKKLTLRHNGFMEKRRFKK